MRFPGLCGGGACVSPEHAFRLFVQRCDSEEALINCSLMLSRPPAYLFKHTLADIQMPLSHNTAACKQKPQIHLPQLPNTPSLNPRTHIRTRQDASFYYSSSFPRNTSICARAQRGVYLFFDALLFVVGACAVC